MLVKKEFKFSSGWVELLSVSQQDNIDDCQSLSKMNRDTLQ